MSQSRHLGPSQRAAVAEALSWRYAVKRFDPARKIAPEDWELLKKSLLLAPSSYGLQQWKFIVVENPAVREQLKAVSWNQSQVTDASHYVVLAYREEITREYVDRHIRRIAEVRGVTEESLAGFRKNMITNLVEGGQGLQIDAWCARQAYIAMGFLMETAALLGIDTCPMEGLEPEAYDRILGLEGTGYLTAGTVALGYRHAEDWLQHAKKVRFEESDIFVTV